MTVYIISMTTNIKKVNNIRYASIRSMDISNGESVGVALFVQGCRLHCHNCFNPETWDFNGGKEWTQETEDKFIKLANRPYIKRLSILGGEPLADENLDGVLHLVDRFRLSFPNKTIWIYSGYIFSELFMYDEKIKRFPNYLRKDVMEIYQKRQQIISKCDVMVDGKYIDSQRDISLRWRGSKNQDVINIQQSLQNGEIVLWTE